MRSISAFAPASASGQDIRLDEMGNLAVVVLAEEIRQRVIEHLRWQLGEWFLRTAEGVPYRSRIFSFSTSVGLAASVITEEIRRVEGVTGVAGVIAEINFETRLLTYRATVSTEEGSFEVEEVNG